MKSGFQTSQNYSLACHPDEPVILCSDGYMAIALQLPPNICCLSMLNKFVSLSQSTMDSIIYQQNIRLNLYQSSKHQVHLRKQITVSNMSAKKHFKKRKEDSKFEFEEGSHTDSILSDRYDEPTAYMFDGLDSGKIVFGEDEDTSCNSEDGHLNEENNSIESLFSTAETYLLQAWGLSATHTGLWTIEHEELSASLTECFVRLHTVGLYLAKNKTNCATLTIQHVLSRISVMFHVLLFDSSNQNLMISSLKMLDLILNMILKNDEGKNKEGKAEMFIISLVMLQRLQCVLSSSYGKTELDDTHICWTNLKNDVKCSSSEFLKRSDL